MRSLVFGLASMCLILAVRPAWTIDESPSSAPLQPSSQNLDIDSDVYQDALMELQGGPEKRAYTYVSEYKRLPIYNFGLGKRWGSVSGDDEKVRFSHRFSRPSHLSVYCSSSGACNKFFQRTRMYSFGLGKRARPYNFGLGKRGNSASFGVEDYEEIQREPVDDFMDKRNRHLYSFGLGKRMSGDEGRGEFGLQRFNFGLGKRGSEDFGHRYQFGLGKRRLIVDDETAVSNS